MTGPSERQWKIFDTCTFLNVGCVRIQTDSSAGMAKLSAESPSTCEIWLIAPSGDRVLLAHEGGGEPEDWMAGDGAQFALEQALELRDELNRTIRRLRRLVSESFDGDPDECCASDIFEAPWDHEGGA